jgi:hypothetical protein
MKMMNDMMNMNGTMNDMGMQMSLQKMDMNTVMYPEISEKHHDDARQIRWNENGHEIRWKGNGYEIRRHEDGSNGSFGSYYGFYRY